MKNLVLFLLVSTFSLCLAAQGTNATTKPAEILVLKEPSFDFGKIQQGHPVTHEFEVINTSTDTVKLQNVQASCGCTTPVWKKDPIAPGASTSINVGYNAASEGPFEKLVSIYYNGGQIKTLAIKGNVFKASTTPAPANASIQLLKQTKQ